MTHYKVAIIGGGPGGYETAIRLNQYSIDCIVFEKEKLGGICLNWGCIPTKSLVKSAEVWHSIKDSELYGLKAEVSELDYSQVYNRKNEIVEKLRSGIEFLFKKRNIPVDYAKVDRIRFEDNKYYLITENREYSCEYLILATGSKPKDLPTLKIDEHNVYSSTGILKMQDLPKSLAIIGGGVVGCEFASIFSTFGVEVNIIEFLPNIVSTEDDEIAKRLQMALKKSGIKIRTGISVEKTEKVTGGLSLTLSDNSEMVVEKVLLSVGRTPVSDIEWETQAPAMSGSVIMIDAKMRTNLHNLYSIGDVTGKMPLAHSASKQGMIAAEDINSIVNNKEFQCDDLIYENIPRCVFTNPEVSSVGLTENQAKDRFTNVKIGRFPFSANGRALTGGDTFGFVKTIAREDNGQLIGMHIIGPQASELIAQGSIFINCNLKADDAERVVFTHPTLSEAIKESIEDLNGLSIHKI